MRLGLLGDTHFNFAWARYAIRKFHSQGIDTVIQVGDLGIYPGESIGKSWNKINDLLVSLGMTFYVAPGNHEDYDRIARLRPVDDGSGWLRFRSNILLAPRGHRNEFDGRSFVWLGGAGSVNKSILLAESSVSRQKEWWPGEAISVEDVERTVAGGHADVMVAHEAPFGVRAIWEATAGNPQGFRSWDIEYAQEIRERLTQAFHGVRPELLLHGHHHISVDEDADFEKFRSRIFGLSCDTCNYSLGELNTDTLEVVHWDIEDDIDTGAWKKAR